MSRLCRLILLPLVVLAGCGQATSYVDRAQPAAAVPTTENAYGVATLSAGRIALATANGIVVIDHDGREVARVALPLEADCVRNFIRALARLPNGKLAFAVECIRQQAVPPTTSEFFEWGLDDDSVVSLGSASQPPFAATWRPDMSVAVYAAEGSLCSTLYTHSGDGSDAPLAVAVEVQGAMMLLGEDLDASPDRCTHDGRATLPAFAPDGADLALIAQNAHSVTGQERIEMPWTLLVLNKDGEAQAILDGMRYPRGLDWLTPDTLVFAAELGGTRALWMVQRDGSGLSMVGADPLEWMAVDRDLLGVAGITLRSPETSVAAGGELEWFDLHSLTTPP